MIALNLHIQRVYIRGKDIEKAYSWLADFFADPEMLVYSMPFFLKRTGPSTFDILPSKDWTVEYDPEPLETPWVRCQSED